MMVMIQYDGYDWEYIEQVIDKYSPLIWKFLIYFSGLENEINLAIAKFINDRADEIWFSIIENVTINNKINLFYKCYLRMLSVLWKSTKKLIKLKTRLEKINTLRNNICHANRQSLSEDKYVRTKITVDNWNWIVKFKKIQITPILIKKNITEINNLMYEISEFTDNSF